MAVFSERFDNLGCDDPERTYRLGIMGGTFDPIHLGHLAVAEQARDQLQLDAVLFMPAGRSPFKAEHEQADPLKRYAMCKLAVEDNEAFDVSDFEASQSGLTYTVDTLKALHNHYPDNVELYFIAGSDAISTLGGWRQSQEMMSLAHFIGVNRPGMNLDDNNVIKKMLRNQGFDVEFIEAPSLEISSSDLRQRLANGASVRYLLSEPVRHYISQEGLYR